MKKILIAVHPKWCEMICNGKKTIEVRRNRPKLEPPFEVLVYETKGQFIKSVRGACTTYGYGRGKVIGSFVCDKVEKITPSVEWGSHGYDTVDDDLLKEMRLERGYLENYGSGVTLYGWHITAPKLFDKPKELSEFYIPCKWYEKGEGCPEDCALFDYDGAIDETDDFCLGKRTIIRPPQSFYYIEEN